MGSTFLRKNGPFPSVKKVKLMFTIELYMSVSTIKIYTYNQTNTVSKMLNVSYFEPRYLLKK